MVEARDKNIDRLWRALFSGENHIRLSNFISGAFMEILKATEKHDLIEQSEYARSRIEKAETDDLSATTKLISIRFDANFKNKKGYDFKADLPSLLQTYSYSNEAQFMDAHDLREIKSYVYRGLQFKCICEQLSFSRNLNAHSNSEANDIGHAILVSGSILRLNELFNFPSEIEKFAKIRSLCYEIVSVVNPLLSDQKSLNSVPVLDTVMIENQVDEVEEKDRIAEEQNESLPVEYLPDPGNEELVRQKMMVLRREIIAFMSSNFPSIKRDKCILSTQIITELLSMKIKNSQDLILSPSLSYLMKTNEEVVAAQLSRFEKSILELLNSSHE